MKSSHPKVFSDDEIEMFLSGDRRQVDRLILTSLNHISSTLLDHTKREDSIWDSLEEIGGLEGVKTRADYIDSLIKKNTNRAAAFGKIAQSTAVWAVIVVIVFVANALWQHILSSLKQH